MSSDAQMTVEQPTVEQPTVQEPAPEQTAPAEQPAPSEQPVEGASERPAKEAGAQPKRPAGGAFGRFLAESRAALAEECKGQPITAVTKLASERFKALSEEDRREWQKKFQEAKEQYEKDMEAFKAAGGEVKPRAEKSAKRKAGKGGKDEGEGAKRRKVADPNAPKRPVGGAFGRFAAKNRAEFQKECAGKPASAVSKLAGEKWKALGEEDKKPFQEEFEKAMADYREAMKTYTPPEGAPAEASAAKPRLSKLAKARAGKGGKRKGGRKAQKDPNAPKRPVGGAFGRFAAKNRAEFQKECAGKPASAVSKLAGDKWKELSEEEKKPFQEEYEREVALYKEAMKSYAPPQQHAAGAAGPETPAKKPRASKGASGSDKKPSAAKPKARGRASKGAAPTLSALHLDASIAAEADKAGLAGTLLKLAALSDVAACGKSQADMLKALQASDGLLHPAKRALLGA